MESFVGHNDNFESDAVGDGEPVQLLEYWGDVVILASFCSKSGITILRCLKFGE